MAEITGLSQSQVYKWCWDQKKKQNKVLERSATQHRKLICKNLGYRRELRDCKGDDPNDNQKNSHTKPRLRTVFQDEEDKETAKKVKRRLFF